MKSILICFIIITLISSLAAAEVSLILDGYNSENSMSMDLIGQNLNYGGLLYVDSQNLIYKNGGASNDPNGFYSFDIGHNGHNFHSSASTESGGFSWTAEIKPTWDASYPDGYPDEFFTLDPKNFIKHEGTLKSSFGNDNVNVKEYIETFDASYSESIGITADKLQAKGGGLTAPLDVLIPEQPKPELPGPYLPEDFISMSDSYTHVEKGPSTETESTNQKVDHSYTDSPTASPQGKENGQIEDGRGFIHQIRVEGENDWGQINAIISGDVLASWNCGVNAKGSDMAFGLGVAGISKDAMQNLQMEAEGSDIPHQFLPPGSIQIDYKTATELEVEQYQQYATAEKDAFYEKYPFTESSNEPWTWYYTKLDAFVEKSAQKDDTPNTNEDATGTPELFQMMMKFYITDNDQSTGIQSLPDHEAEKSKD
jgi:hypothetical protein